MSFAIMNDRKEFRESKNIDLTLLLDYQLLFVAPKRAKLINTPLKKYFARQNILTMKLRYGIVSISAVIGHIAYRCFVNHFLC